MGQRLWTHVITALTTSAVLCPVTGLQADAPVIKGPRFVSHVDVSDCYPAGSAAHYREGSITVSLTISPDGKVTHVEFPPGTPSWLQNAAQCAVDRHEFSPGTRDGVPVQSQATLPINFGILGSSGLTAPIIKPPVLRSNELQLEAAYSDCYPADLEGVQMIVYRTTVGVDGRARGSKAVTGSGDRRLDKAGACVLGKLHFTPALRGSQAVKTTITWNLLVRPPVPE